MSANQPLRLHFYQHGVLHTLIEGDGMAVLMRALGNPLTEIRALTGKASITLLGTDRNASVLHVSTTSSHSAQRYSPYGYSLRESTAAALGFNGEYRDTLLNDYLLGNGHRLLCAGLGYFAVYDALSPFGAGGLNGYVYCEGDPVNWTDPSGRVRGQRNHPGLSNRVATGRVKKRAKPSSQRRPTAVVQPFRPSNTTPQAVTSQASPVAPARTAAAATPATGSEINRAHYSANRSYMVNNAVLINELGRSGQDVPGTPLHGWYTEHGNAFQQRVVSLSEAQFTSRLDRELASIRRGMMTARSRLLAPPGPQNPGGPSPSGSQVPDTNGR